MQSGKAAAEKNQDLHLTSVLPACRALIPMHKDLRLSGQLPPLDAPHHMRATEWGVFREGVVLNSAPGAGSLLDIGLDKVLSFSPCHDLGEWLEPFHDALQRRHRGALGAHCAIRCDLSVSACQQHICEEP